MATDAASFTCHLLCLFFFFPDARKEHKSHSPSCHFIALKKKVEELSVEEFFKLQMERQKFFIVRAFRCHGCVVGVVSAVISCSFKHAIPTCFTLVSPRISSVLLLHLRRFGGFPLRTRDVTVASSANPISFPLLAEQIQ